jgi:hypothetical protein
MEKEEIGEESMEQQETIEERRSHKEIKKELDDIRYAIKKEKQIDQLETSDMDKRAKRERLILNHINKMRKLHDKQAALYKEFLKCKMLKYRREPWIKRK